MRRGSGRFREIVAYKSRTAGSLLRGEVWTHLLFVENALHASNV